MDKNKNIQVISVPLDLGASHRGTDAAPASLHKAGLNASLQTLGYRLAVNKNILIPKRKNSSNNEKNARYKHEILQVCTNLARETSNTLARQATPLVLGGDHSIAMGTVSGVSSFYHRNYKQRIGLVWLDAHGDMNIPETSPSGNVHGMPLAHLLGYGDKELANVFGYSGKVNPENVALVGVRDVDEEEQKLIQHSGINVFTMAMINQLGMNEISRRIIQCVSHNTVGFHLSFDVDACDPSVIPGSGTLVPDGINFNDANSLLAYCAKNGNMISMEVAELNPLFDKSDVSANRTIRLINSAFGQEINLY